MKHRFLPALDVLTYLAIGPLIVFIVLATGLVASLAFIKVAARTGLSSEPASAPIYRPAALPDALAAPNVVSHLAEPAALREPAPTRTRSQHPLPTPTPGFISRWLGLVINVLSSPATPTIRQHLPTLTPTPGSGQSAPALAPMAAGPAAAETPIPVAPDAPASVPQPPDETSPEEINQVGVGWSVVGTQTTFNEGEAVVMGVLINNTGSPQTAIELTGTFYDAQGKVIQDQIDTSSYVPVEIIPVEAHIPFELDAISPQPVSRVDVQVKSSPATDSPRQDFQITGLKQWTDTDGMYCLSGQVENPGDPVQGYLAVYATLYDNMGHLVSFSDYAPSIDDPSGQGADFEMCLDPLGHTITRHEVKALGY